MVLAAPASGRPLTRFLIRHEGIAGERVTFDAEETRHLTRVLRLRPGDVLEAFDGLGNALTVRLERTSGRLAYGTLLARAALQSESPLHLTLAQSIPKGDKMEGIIRMATELGAARVVPLVTARTVVRVELGRPGPRLSRWQRVAKEAAKQSGRALITEVTPPQSLAAWLAIRETDGLLVGLWEDATEPLGPQLPPRPVSRATVVVGPEGGLERTEADALRASGAVVGGLGPRILRTETAGPVGLAILQMRYGDLGGGGS